MKFKDKLELPIKMEKEKRKEILEVIAKINEEINRINKSTGKVEACKKTEKKKENHRKRRTYENRNDYQKQN